MDESPRLLEVFFDVFRGLPRHGPGLDESTVEALALCEGLPANPTVLDIGCGPGMQTIALAKATHGHITAVDTHEESLNALRNRARTAGVTSKVEAQHGDMNDLAFPPSRFDLIWAEGSAYIMGFENALTQWKPLLKPGGYLAVSELAWLQADAPSAIADFFAQEYPDMKSVDRIVGAVNASGYDLIDHFTLPDNAWWDHYYTPLEHKLPALRQRYKADDEALAVIQMTEHEIDMRRRFPESYGYEFFVARRPFG